MHGTWHLAPNLLQLYLLFYIHYAGEIENWGQFNTEHFGCFPSFPISLHTLDPNNDNSSSGINVYGKINRYWVISHPVIPYKSKSEVRNQEANSSLTPSGFPAEHKYDLRSMR